MAKKLTAAEIAAQKQSMEEAEIQRAFEQGITTLRDLISPSSIEIQSDHFRLGALFMSMVILVPSVPAGSVLSLISMKCSIFLFTSIRSTPL